MFKLIQINNLNFKKSCYCSNYTNITDFTVYDMTATNGTSCGVNCQGNASNTEHCGGYGSDIFEATVLSCIKNKLIKEFKIKRDNLMDSFLLRFNFEHRVLCGSGRKLHAEFY